MPTREIPLIRIATNSLRDTIADILERVGTPMHYAAIHAELINRGYPVAKLYPVQIGQRLSFDTRFVSRGGGMWALASWDHWPRRGAYPENQDFPDPLPPPQGIPMLRYRLALRNRARRLEQHVGKEITP